MFISDSSLSGISWQALERLVERLAILEGFGGVRLVGQSSDGGADLVAHKGSKRWLFQVKRWHAKPGSKVVDETRRALARYRANVPVIVSLSGFPPRVREDQQVLMDAGIPLQLWDRARLLQRARRVPLAPLAERDPDSYVARPYQRVAIEAIVGSYLDPSVRTGLVVMATGLGKTFVAAEAIRRLRATKDLRVMVLAHTNDLVYQLERAFWPFMGSADDTVVWNGSERPEPDRLSEAQFVFACVDSVAGVQRHESGIERFDVVIVDECHHAASPTYASALDTLDAGRPGGPFLLGLTATPWRPENEGFVIERFGAPLVTVDLVTGMRNGYLTDVDYRLYTDNVDWDGLSTLRGERFSPRAINRTLFITEWDDGVVQEFRRAWTEREHPRAIVFCGTADHAERMRDRINSLGFCRAEALLSRTSRGEQIRPWERNRILADFEVGHIGVICAVDILNEGIDVPEVNLLVFQRVTHSRRIFVQQLGRGLRLAPGKEDVTVLDFVSDIRRFAAGIRLKDQLGAVGPRPGRPTRIRLNHSVEFRKVGGADPETEGFLREWLEDVASIEEAGDDASVLKYPPIRID